MIGALLYHFIMFGCSVRVFEGSPSSMSDRWEDSFFFVTMFETFDWNASFFLLSELLNLEQCHLIQHFLWRGVVYSQVGPRKRRNP